MKKIIRLTSIVIFFIGCIWLVLTLWVESPGPRKLWQVGNSSSGPKVLIVFDPDPIYNLDEQICLSFAHALADRNIRVQVTTVAAAIKMEEIDVDAFVFCANTYNWSPDWALCNFIENQGTLKGKDVVAITLGSGSTEAAQKELENLILSKEGKILNSRSLWLMRPNDEARLKDSNVTVANEIIYTWATEIAKKILHNTK